MSTFDGRRPLRQAARMTGPTEYGHLSELIYVLAWVALFVSVLWTLKRSMKRRE